MRFMCTLAAFALVGLARPSDGQIVGDSLRAPFAGWFTGAAIGVPGSGSQADAKLYTVGLSLTQIRPGGLGADLWLGSMSRALVSFGLVGAARANAAFPLDLGRDVVLLPTAGLSFVGAAGEGGGEIFPGLNAGLSAVFGRGPFGVRAGATVHQFGNAPIWLVEIGIIARSDEAKR